MGNQEKRIKIISLVWLIITQIVAILSTLFWFMGWAMAFAEDAFASVATIFVTSYPLFVIVSIITGWITFMKKKYLQLVLWSVLPVIWWLIFFTLGKI